MLYIRNKIPFITKIPNFYLDTPCLYLLKNIYVCPLHHISCKESTEFRTLDSSCYTWKELQMGDSINWWTCYAVGTFCMVYINLSVYREIAKPYNHFSILSAFFQDGNIPINSAWELTEWFDKNENAETNGIHTHQISTHLNMKYFKLMS